MKKLLIIGAGICLSISSCSSRRTDKFIEKESFSIEYKEDTKYEAETESSKHENTIIQRADFGQWFNFEYQPLFDQFGQLIPFSIEHTVNGQTEKVTITGANVTGGQNKSNHQSQTIKDSKSRTKTLMTYKTETTYKTHTTYVSKVKERYSFGPQSIYMIALIIGSITLAILAITGHWNWIKNILQKGIYLISGKS